MDTLILGAVAYDPKVVTIWEGFKDYFIGRGLGFDFVLYSNYERMVEGHLRGEIHLAWNSPLAWIETERLAPRLARAIAVFLAHARTGRPSHRARRHAGERPGRLLRGGVDDNDFLLDGHRLVLRLLE